MEIHRGLSGVYFDRTAVTRIDGKAGTLHYRGVSIHDLAEKSSFEETAYLLLHARLPSRAELEAFDSQLKLNRPVPDAVHALLRSLRGAHPMEVLRTAASALGALDPEVGDNSPAATIRKGVRLTAQLPTIVATLSRIRNDQDPLPPRGSLGHAANFLHMLGGEEPSELAADLLDRDFILHAEHGSNASSFTARVVTGTGANLHASITAAIGALSGPAHGGAAEKVMTMARAIGAPERAKEYVQQLRKNREPVMGFGHRVYRAEDPRARHLRDGVKRLSQEKGEPHWFRILEAVVEEMKPYARRGVNVNVDFYAAVLYHLLGIPEDLFVPIFAMGRVPGWTVQTMEQREQNILIRPLLQYTGPADLAYTPIDKRESSTLRSSKKQ